MARSTDWEFESTNVSRMMARGFNRVSARIGDTITVRYNPRRSGAAGRALHRLHRFQRPSPTARSTTADPCNGVRWRPHSMTNPTTTEDQVFAKCERRLIPFLGLLYLVSLVDRLNVGFAALTMNADLGFTPFVFGFGAGIFFIGYSLFQVPANLMLVRFGARRWVFAILIVWGAISAACAFVQGPIELLCPALPVGRCGSRIVSGRRALPHLLVSAGAPRPGDRELHGGEPACLHPRRSALRSAARHGRFRRSEGLAVALHHRGPARVSSRLCAAQARSRRSRARHVAECG